MKTLTSSLAVAIILGTFSHISANDAIDAKLEILKNANPIEQKVMVRELNTELNKLTIQERVQIMQNVQDQMPDIAQKIQNENITQKIEAIKNAQPMERRELMNDFKKDLAQMNEEERAKAISLMREDNTDSVKTQKKSHIKSMAQDAQMKSIQHMGQKEQMNQFQGAIQFNQTPQQGSGSQGFGQKR